jgi:hypothetical protein
MKTARRIEPLFLFLFARSERRLPTRRRAFLAGRSGDCFDLLFLWLLCLAITLLFAFRHFVLLGSLAGYHLRRRFGESIKRHNELSASVRRQHRSKLCSTHRLPLTGAEHLLAIYHALGLALQSAGCADLVETHEPRATSDISRDYGG